MKTILIVDDEPAARYGLRRALESKYRVTEADSAEGAREALPREQPDLVLLDVVLPGQSGIEFLRWMRAQGSDIPVLMVSALDTAKGGLFGQGIRIGGAAAARGESFEAGVIGERERCAEAKADQRRTVRADDWAHGGDAAGL